MRRRDFWEQFRIVSSRTAYWLAVGSAVLTMICILMTAFLVFAMAMGATGSPYALPVCLLNSCMFGSLFLLWLKVYRQRRNEAGTTRTATQE